MFSQFGATADSLSKASTMVFRIGTDAHLYDDPDDVSIVPLLDSKFDSEKCEALKRLLALIAQGFDVSNYFPQVVKNVASQSLEVKKLVYLYLLHYAEKYATGNSVLNLRPNEALLSINCFQKDVGDPNPLVRARALRTMAGIRLHVIAPLILMAVGKCARDPSVYVRKCAANALPKLHDLRLEEHIASIEEIVGILLNDNSPGVVGAAAAAFASICPNNLSLIGRNYRRLCETLPDVEEWGQIVLVGILLRYVVAKHGLVEGSIMSPSRPLVKDISESEDQEPHLAITKNLDDIEGEMCSEIADVVSRSYLEGPEKYLSRLSCTDEDPSSIDISHFTSSKSNDDVKVLLQCTSPLLWSHNSAVVLASAGVHWIMAPKEEISKIVKPLLFLLRSSNASKYVVLCNIQVFCKAMPSLFVPHFEDFFVCTSDSYQVKALKLEILSSIATYSSITAIFLEFQDYVRDQDRRFAADTVAAIGLCSQRLPDVANTCLEGLLALALSESSTRDVASADEEAVLVQAINSIKTIIKQNPPSHEKVIVYLARSLDSIVATAARAMIIWMVGEYNNVGGSVLKILPTLFKYLAGRFSLEAAETKLQILNACAKVLLHAEGEGTSILKKIVGYVLELAKYDLSYDIRDRARYLKNLLSHCIGSPYLEEVKDQPEIKDLTHILTESILGGRKKKPLSEPLSYRFYLPGSLSQIVLHAAPGYEPLPEPCSLVYDESCNVSTDVQGIEIPGFGVANNKPNGNDVSEGISGSLDEENTSEYSSRESVTGSSGSGGSYSSGPASDVNDNADPLIHLSDADLTHRNSNEVSGENANGIDELLSKRDLESWLDESTGLNSNSSDLGHVPRSLARISIKDIRGLVKPKSYTLLDPANGNGLSVEYTFSSEASGISPLLVCLHLSFKNCSKEPMSDILLDEESNRSPDSSDQSVSESSSVSRSEVPTLVPVEVIASLEPGQTVKRILHVRFQHHLLHLKLILECNGRKHSVKLRPDIGYFVKPLPMDIEEFANKESHLPGMFEYIRRCTFTDHISELNDSDDSTLVKDNFLLICEKLALKMLSNANLFLVSVDLPVATHLNDLSGLCLRFSCEILSNSLPCLITLTLKGTCSEPLDVSVKINCEETVFGLNLLNRIINFLAEPTS